MSNRHISPWARMESWLRWRSELAAALGLVEPQDDELNSSEADRDIVRRTFGPNGIHPMPEVMRVVYDLDTLRTSFAARVAKAVAAELRAQADALRLDECQDADADEYYSGQESGFVQGQQDAADRLRARADELDPVDPKVADE